MPRDSTTHFAFAMAAVLFYGAPFEVGATVANRPPIYLEQRPSLEKYTDAEIAVLEKLNRADAAHLSRLRRIAAPADWTLEVLRYSPLPQELPCVAAPQKFIAVHLPTQVFGAYERGTLVRWGPISSGREKHATPSGLFNLNWRSRARTSTEDPDWHMEWYFNFENRRGLAFHQYELPGRPASHACIRLLKRDATWLYHWGESWTLTPDGREVLQPGTPVYIMGEYAYEKPKPWLEPTSGGDLLAMPLPDGVCESIPDPRSSPLLLTDESVAQPGHAVAGVD